jgi:hypothetical protein
VIGKEGFLNYSRSHALVDVILVHLTAGLPIGFVLKA